MLGKIILLVFLILQGISQDPNISYERKKDLTELFPSAEFLYFKYPEWDLPGSENYVSEEAKRKILSKDKNFIDVELSAAAALVVDGETNQILYDKKANTRRQVGSLTKVMTSLVFLEENANLEKEVVVPSEALSAAREGADIKLKEGECFLARDLLEALLVASANDAAVALAVQNSGNEEEFVKLMNEKASALGLVNTHFTNVTGFDDPRNYSSAFDLAKIFKEAYKKDFFRKSTQKLEGTIVSLNTDESHYFKNTDKLLTSYLDVEAGKTGFTDEAGECLILLTEDFGRRFITVILGSENRFQDAKALLSFVKDAYHIPEI